MPAIKRKVYPALDEKWRGQINKAAPQIINRLRDHTLADEDIMSNSQIKAAQILLAKVMPDLKQTEHTGPGGEALPAINVTFVEAKPEKAIELQAEVNEPRPLDEPLTLEQRAKALEDN